MTVTRAAPRTTRSVVASTALAVAALDWVTKWLVAVTLDDRVVQLPGLTLRLGHNPGVAFGMGDDLPVALVVAVTAAVTAVVATLAMRGAMGPTWVGGLIVGGAVANLGDRLIGGSVVDFLDLGWWPAFNVADIALSAGCALVVILSLRTPPADS